MLSKHSRSMEPGLPDHLNNIDAGNDVVRIDGDVEYNQIRYES